jgi:hypothetical protein
MNIMKKIDGLATVAFLAAAVSASPVSVAGVLPSQPDAEQNFGKNQNGGRSLSITYRRSTGGITQIAASNFQTPI